MIQLTRRLDRVYGINNSYIIRGKFRTKKKEVSDYQKEWQYLAQEHRHLFKNFNPKEKYLTIETVWYNPKFYKKDGSMSKTAGDTDGIIKFIKDGICDGLGINDAFVKKESISQLPTNEKHHAVSVLVGIENLINI